MLVRDSRSTPGLNPLIGPHREGWGVRFPDMTCIYDKELGNLIRRAAQTSGVWIKEGVLGVRGGPSYETPSEIKEMEDGGIDAAGMSIANGEAIMANAWGLKVAALSCISNYAANRRNPPLTQEEVEETLRETMPRLKLLLSTAFELMKNI